MEKVLLSSGNTTKAQWHWFNGNYTSSFWGCIGRTILLYQRHFIRVTRWRLITFRYGLKQYNSLCRLLRNLQKLYLLAIIIVWWHPIKQLFMGANITLMPVPYMSIYGHHKMSWSVLLDLCCCWGKYCWFCLCIPILVCCVTFHNDSSNSAPLSVLLALLKPYMCGPSLIGVGQAWFPEPHFCCTVCWWMECCIA